MSVKCGAAIDTGSGVSIREFGAMDSLIGSDRLGKMERQGIYWGMSGRRPVATDRLHASLPVLLYFEYGP